MMSKNLFFSLQRDNYSMLGAMVKKEDVFSMGEGLTKIRKKEQK